MRTTRLGVLGAVLALAAPAAGTAEPGLPRGERDRWMLRAEHMARFLGLTEEQQQEMRKLIDERRADHEAVLEKLGRNREAMKQALESAGPDPAAVGELAIEGHRLRQQERALRDAQEEAIRHLLTADQKVRFDAMKALREHGRDAHPGGPGPRHERGPGRP